MKVLCIGDSLTHGSIGYSFVKFLKPEFKTINKGINGDTTLGAYKRLQKYLRSPRYSKIHTYVVSIGTNDILLPYLSTLSPVWKVQMQCRMAVQNCIVDDTVFAESYENILQILKANHKNAILVGLPLVQMPGFPLHKIQRRNDIIKQLADQYNMPFIDTYSLQESVSKSPLRLYSWGAISLLRVLDGLLMVLLPFSKDLLSRARRLELTVDGIHFNSLSAKTVAAQIRQYILPADLNLKRNEE